MHKCIMTGAMVVVENGTPTQPLVAMFIQLMFLLVVLKMAPYNDDLDDWSSFVCSFALTLTTLGGFLLMVWEQGSEDTVISVELLTTLLIGINGLCFAYEMLVIGYVACQDRLTAARLKKTRKNEKSNSNSNSPTKVQPVNNVFLLEEDDDEDDAESFKSWTPTKTNADNDASASSMKEKKNKRVVISDEIEEQGKAGGWA